MSGAARGGWLEPIKHVSVNWNCRGCNRASAMSGSYDDGKATFKMDPHYCTDDLIVPGCVITVFDAEKPAPKKAKKKA